MLIISEFFLIFLFNIAIYNAMLDSLFLSFLFILVLYSMRVYDEINWDIKKQFTRTFASSILLLIIVLISKPLFRWDIEWKQVFSSIVFSFFALLPIRNIVFVIERNRARKYFFVGNKNELNGIVESIKEKYPKFDILFLNPEISDVVYTVVSSNKRKNLLVVSEKYLTYLNGYLGKNNLLPEFIEKKLKKIPLKMIELYPRYYIKYFENIKESKLERILDIFVSIFALLIFSPVMLIISLSILIEDGRPVIYKQKRVGKDGKIFTMYKFRSMKNVGREKPLFADQEQDRITKVGRIIRKLRFDEIPQFFNVLKGNMSVIGPRPEAVEFHSDMLKKIPFYDYRLKVKPGISGWAQMNYKHTTNLEEYKIKTEYDLWYVKNKNVMIDLKVTIQTLETMLFKRGAK